MNCELLHEVCVMCCHTLLHELLLYVLLYVLLTCCFKCEMNIHCFMCMHNTAYVISCNLTLCVSCHIFIEVVMTITLLGLTVKIDIDCV